MMIRIHLYDELQRKGMTQRELAFGYGIREGTVSDMCNERCVLLRVGSLNKICAALECRIEDLLEYIPDE